MAGLTEIGSMLMDGAERGAGALVLLGMCRSNDGRAARLCGISNHWLG
jgi:hypothetical protein